MGVNYISGNSISCMLLPYTLFDNFCCYYANDVSESVHVVDHTVLGSLPHLLFVAGKTSVSRGRQKIEPAQSLLSIFKGRAAKLNRAILMTLFRHSPLVVYDITKEIKKGFRATKLH